MLDLDNLKYINDTYGHEYGDIYIRKAASAFGISLTGKAIYGRISGDEFNVFLYGYSDRSLPEEQIHNLKTNMDSMTIAFPDGKFQKLQASGGVAWYPDDGMVYEELFKYADYAMYTVKKTHKGEIHDFDKESFQQQNNLIRNKATVNRMIQKRLVYYAFQPIVDAHTGKIFAYEALMRPGVPEFTSVQDVLEIASMEGMLNHIEEMTWFLGMECFEENIRAGRIAADSYLFVNSIPNQRMPQKKEDEFKAKYGQYFDHLVMELTEEERVDGECWEEKMRYHKSLGGKIALDDYGSGYNSEKALLSVSPDFVKVDIAIVRNIHQSTEKQTIMEYIVNYAHKSGKYIIAEGVEIPEEVRTVIALGADYLQGYYMAKPKRYPDGISKEGLQLIRQINSQDEMYQDFLNM